MVASPRLAAAALLQAPNLPCPAAASRAAGSWLATEGHRTTHRDAMEDSNMDTYPGTVTVWQSGRLAAHAAPRRTRLTRAQWLGAALLVLAAVVLTFFVGVLRQAVDRGELAQAAQRSGGMAQQDVAQPGRVAVPSAAP
jgi:hypothetical protein